jgi:hypothetical protein
LSCASIPFEVIFQSGTSAALPSPAYCNSQPQNTAIISPRPKTVVAQICTQLNAECHHPSECCSQVCQPVSTADFPAYCRCLGRGTGCFINANCCSNSCDKSDVPYACN